MVFSQTTAEQHAFLFFYQLFMSISNDQLPVKQTSYSTNQ